MKLCKVKQRIEKGSMHEVWLQEMPNATCVSVWHLWVFLLMARRSLRDVLMLMKPKGFCVTTVSTVLLLLGPEKKMWQICSFHDQWAIDDPVGF